MEKMDGKGCWNIFVYKWNINEFAQMVKIIFSSFSSSPF